MKRKMELLLLYTEAVEISFSIGKTSRTKRALYPQQSCFSSTDRQGTKRIRPGLSVVLSPPLFQSFFFQCRKRTKHTFSSDKSFQELIPGFVVRNQFDAFGKMEVRYSYVLWIPNQNQYLKAKMIY